jgi:L-threonylcarbamoyladenylate synthase
MASSADRAGCVPATTENIRRAAERLNAGELVIVPTETVYGVAARADSPDALAKLYAAKGREEAKRIALFAAGLEAVRATGAQVDEIAARLAATFWPGPLTLVLPKAAGGWDGFRCPDHPVAQAWLRELGNVVPAVTSANRSGEPPALTAPDAWAALAPHVALALDAGPVAVGAASTVARIAAGEIEILRPGPVGRDDLARAGRCSVRG